MQKGRIEAFSDGVIAIIITIMVLELKVPHGTSLHDIAPLLPVFLSYVLSFIYVGIYWNNHHHMFHAAQHVSGSVMWANLHLLFWLSLVPFVTAWMGENHLASWPVRLYGCVLLMSAAAFTLLMTLLVRNEGENSALARAMGRDFKGKLSLLLYGVALGLSFLNPLLSLGIYVAVAAVWFLPDPRVERVLKTGAGENKDASRPPSVK